MWILPIFAGLIIACKLLGKHPSPSVINISAPPGIQESQEILKEYNRILEKLDASPYGPFMRVGGTPHNAALTWTSPEGMEIVITVRKYGKALDAEIKSYIKGNRGEGHRGGWYSKTAQNSPPLSDQILPCVSRLVRQGKAIRQAGTAR
jgi:hypothetical protein